MASGKVTMNTKSLLAALILAGSACGSGALLAAEISTAAVEHGARALRTAAPKAPLSYTKAMIEEVMEAQAAQQLMPYLLALRVDGQTADGVTVRINVPVKFTDLPKELAHGLFPRGDEGAGQARLMRAYYELESIFSEELHKASQRFHSSDFHQAAHNDARRCNVGTAEVCAALEAPLQTALQRAQAGKPYALHLVQEWVNFHGFVAAD